MKAVKKFHSQPQPRKNRVSILLNDREMRALERYCNQYTVKNRSRLIRETLMRNILKRFVNFAIQILFNVGYVGGIFNPRTVAIFISQNRNRVCLTSCATAVGGEEACVVRSKSKRCTGNDELAGFNVIVKRTISVAGIVKNIIVFPSYVGLGNVFLHCVGYSYSLLFDFTGSRVITERYVIKVSKGNCVVIGICRNTRTINFNTAMFNSNVEIGIVGFNPQSRTRNAVMLFTVNYITCCVCRSIRATSL